MTYDCFWYCDADFDPADAFWEDRVVARKLHECCECGSQIDIGERHERTKLVADGHFETYRTCLLCSRIRADHCRSWIFGNLRSVLWECLGLDYVTGETIDDEEVQNG